MESRRTFLKASAAAAVVSKTVLGANDRVQMGIIGPGWRGMTVWGCFAKHADCVFIAAADVNSKTLAASAQKIGGKVDTYSDYRKLLERKDIDAVLVATPDHWHSPITVDAFAAGKDVYVEKPISNTVEAAQRMMEASKKYNKLMQLGVQQRSGAHFNEAAKIVQSGQLGKISHAVMVQPGAYNQAPQPATAPPPELDWEAWQGPAPRRPYSPMRRMWRAFYMYGGGLVTDWGVHLTDIMNMYLGCDTKGPLVTSASAQYVNAARDLEQVPDSFVCSWQYENFVASFTNAVPPGTPFNSQGNWFYGTRGVLHINRSGYQVFPVQGRGMPGGPPPPPPIEAKTVDVKEDYENDPDTTAHTRNFLDCVKSRRQPVANAEVGFYSTLPCLIALMAIQQGRPFAWDGNAVKPV
jgi:predicted dehydrogenase